MSALTLSLLNLGGSLVSRPRRAPVPTLKVAENLETAKEANEKPRTTGKRSRMEALAVDAPLGESPIPVRPVNGCCRKPQLSTSLVPAQALPLKNPRKPLMKGLLVAAPIAAATAAAAATEGVGGGEEDSKDDGADDDAVPSTGRRTGHVLSLKELGG